MSFRKNSEKGKELVYGSVTALIADWYNQNRIATIGVGMVGIVVLAVVIPVAIYHSIAASGAVSFEAESGSVSSKASTFTDSNASAGQFVQFGSSSGGNTGGADTTCVFQKADQPLNVAFCDAFDSPQNGGTQTGDLDPVLWGVSRIAGVNLFQNVLNAVSPSHNACAGGGVNANGATFGPATPPPADMRICNGQMAGSKNDAHGDVNIDTYPKQPFNFANRTGTVVFDVSADSGGTHAAWPEFLITDEPVPGIRRNIADTPIFAVNEIGFSIDELCNGQPNGTTVGVVMFSKNSNYQELNSGFRDCVKKGSRTAMNHVEVRINTSQIEVWASDGGSTTLKKIATEQIPGGLGFTQGLVWFNDATYNARKEIEPCECGLQYDHTLFWDNVGFDGPKTYRDIGYDIPYANAPAPTSDYGDPQINEGYQIGRGPQTFTLNNVTWSQTPTKVKVVLNAVSYDTSPTLSVSLNGHTAVGKPLNTLQSRQYHSMSLDLPVSDLVQGTNTLKFTSTGDSTMITNMSLILVAGAPVP